MLISVVIPSFYPAIKYGGTIYASLNYVKVLAEIGHKVQVSTTNSDMDGKLDVPTGQFLEFGKNILVKYYNETIVDKLSIPLWMNIYQDIKAADFVHVHALFNTPIPMALFFARRYSKPVLLSPHGVLGNWVMNNGSAWKQVWLNLFIRPFASYVHWHATSEQEQKEILTHFPNAKVFIIPVPLELEEFKQVNTLSRSSFLMKFADVAGEPEKILISMARLQKKKGLDILIRAFKGVLSQYPEAYLFIAGQDEGGKSGLVSMAQELNIDKRVIFTGSIRGQDKVDFMANADLFILPSHNENFGIVYAEALAAGTPVIASKETPWEEVERFGCGKWVSNTVGEFEEAIMEMLNNKDPEIQVKARSFVEKFSFGKVLKEMDTALHVIENRNA